MKPDELLLRELLVCANGANVHQVKNLEYAYRGFCRRAGSAKTAQGRRQAREMAKSLEEDMRVLSIVASMIANDVRIRREASIKQQVLASENLRLRSALEDRYRPENIIGDSGEMRSVYTAIQQVAQSNTTVLIRGESGTGKELVAHAIHYLSRH